MYRSKWGDALRLGVNAGWLNLFVDKRVDGRLNCAIPRYHMPHLCSALEVSFIIKRYTNLRLYLIPTDSHRALTALSGPLSGR